MSKLDHTNVEVGDIFKSKSAQEYKYEVLFVNEEGALLKYGNPTFWDFKSIRKHLEKVIPKTKPVYLITYREGDYRFFDENIASSREEAEDIIDDCDYKNAFIIEVEDTYHE